MWAKQLLSEYVTSAEKRQSNVFMKRDFFKKLDWNLFRDYMEYFLVYCVLGWVYESIWCCMIYHKRGFINRGFLFGPWLPIYGFGFFIIMGIFKLLKVKKPLWVFVVGTIIATTAELIASYIIDATLGTPMWDYHGYFMNFDGRIALEPALMFGLMIWAALCLLQPAIIKLQNKFRKSKIHNNCFIVITILFFVDLIARIWLGSNI
jgi:uncharacterized membrane protein